MLWREPVFMETGAGLQVEKCRLLLKKSSLSGMVRSGAESAGDLRQMMAIAAFVLRARAVVEPQAR
jgi:hypothetical protein